MKYWILKTEPETFSWQNLKQKGSTHWDGVRNFQAQNYMKQMKTGDEALIYHSGAERKIVGMAEVSKEFYPDHTDATGKFGMVDVKYRGEIKNTLSLSEIKNITELQNLGLVRQSRLSVIPVNEAEWKVIAKLVL